MKESGLIICFVVGFVAFVVGWLKGCEHELSRIRHAFNLRGYSRGEFDDILEKYEPKRTSAIKLSVQTAALAHDANPTIQIKIACAMPALD